MFPVIPSLVARACLLGAAVLLVAAPAHAQTPTFAPGVALGTVNTFDLWEASGILVSRQNPGVLWTHNDGGYAGSAFALATNGNFLGRYEIPNVYSGDFEDISFGPGPLPYFNYIYLGDIGDNYTNRPYIRVFRFPEPAVYRFQSNAPTVIPIYGAEEIFLNYPAGEGPFNCEAMFVDPVDGSLYLITKQMPSGRLYRATRAELDGVTVTLTYLQDVPFNNASGADISADGSLIALRRSSKASLWVRAPGQSVSDALAGTPNSIPLIGRPTELNGEAIGFDATASAYYTISEGFNQPIYYFARTNLLPAQPRVYVRPGAYWFFEASGTPQPGSWRLRLDDDWPNLFAPLGYGGGELSTLPFGNPTNKVNTTYLRNVFTVSGALPGRLALRVCFNDGVAVYLNGTEIARVNLPAGAAAGTHATLSNTNRARTWYSFAVNPALLHAGVNVLAAEVHRADADGPSLNFDAQLLEASADLPPRIKSVQFGGGNCTLQIQGPNGRTVAVEKSTDLQSWSLDQILVLTDGAATFIEKTTDVARYYRLAP